MKRFWHIAAAEPDGDLWRVTLDGKPVRIPGGAALHLPTRAIAAAVAAEWQAAGSEPGGEMSYDDVKLTRLIGTAQERIAPNPEPVVLELARYAESDLLCYRTTHPPRLAERQHAQWQPWLDWAAERYGARLETTTDLTHVSQPPQALAALAAAVARQCPLGLAALGVAVPATGSLVLGLALAEGALDAAGAHAAAAVDEVHQAEVWGEDHEAAFRLARIAADLDMAATLLNLLRDAA